MVHLQETSMKAAATSCSFSPVSPRTSKETSAIPWTTWWIWSRPRWGKPDQRCCQVSPVMHLRLGMMLCYMMLHVFLFAGGGDKMYMMSIYIYMYKQYVLIDARIPPHLIRILGKSAACEAVYFDPSWPGIPGEQHRHHVAG